MRYATRIAFDDCVAIGYLPSVESVNEFIKIIAKAIEGVAVIVIVVSILYAALRYVRPTRNGQGHDARSPYDAFRARLGHGLLVGLEILVAGDIIYTVALEPTLINVAALGLLVIVRVILGWSIAVEIEGHWPWEAHAHREKHAESGK